MHHQFLLALLALAVWAARAEAQPVNAPVSGEIQRITIDNPSDPWSGGTMVVGGGHVVTIPRNLLMDLPANRLTLQQLFAQAPAACVAVGETGLAKGDTCNTSGAAAIATIAANRTNAGNVIAGDVFIQKGLEAVTGQVSYIDHTDGYFRLNGLPGDATTGVMVRLNDPPSRHTVQQGLGCGGGPNCSADPRFTLDPDNYTNTFSSGYPLCVPSTVQRTFADVLGLGVSTAQAAPDGTGDVLCPMTNRPAAGPAADSRRFAPIKLGDNIAAEGNFETVGGVRFLSAHTTMVLSALSTSTAAGQPDYMFIEEAFIDMAGFQNQRARSLFIGFTTLTPSDVMLWSLHYDPVTNATHEFPLGSTAGCDAAAGPGTCSGQGLVVSGADIFRIRHDVDFLVGAKARLNPCAHLVADPRFPPGICPAGGAAEDTAPAHLAEQFAILSPIPHQIQARTGRKFASLQAGTPLTTVDIRGNEATNGQYLFPFGINLGGIDVPNPFEFNLNGVTQPYSFSGLPWLMDRRLSPGGCLDLNGDGTVDCEATPQPLDPFPFEQIDPRLQANLPLSGYGDPNFTAAPLSRVANRILSFVDGALGNFNGDATVLAWPPADPAALPIAPTLDVNLVCAAAPPPVPNSPPIAVSDVAFTTVDVPVAIEVLANDSDPDGNTLTIAAVSGAINGVVANTGVNVVYTPNAGFSGADAFAYTVTDGLGAFATAVVSVRVDPAVPPIVLAPTAVAGPDQNVASGALVTLDGSLSTDPAGLALSFAWTQVAGPAVTLSDPALVAPTFTAPIVPDGGLPVLLAFSLTVTNAGGVASAPSIVSITVSPLPVAPLAPVANAGSPQTVSSNAVVTLDGAASSDPNVPTLGLTFAWSQTAGTPVLLAFADSARASFTAPINAGIAPEVLGFQLTVTNAAGLSSTATVDVTVNPVLAPVAFAESHGGAGATVLAGSASTLHGEESTDPQGLPLTFSWTQASGLPVTLIDADLPHAAFTAPALQPGQTPAVLVFSLVVSNGFVQSAPSLATVTVIPPGDIVTITRVEYRIADLRLRVDASSTSTTALLTLQPVAPGTAAIPMVALGGGNFTLDVISPRPTNDTVTVTSSLGGSATSPITRLR